MAPLKEPMNRVDRLMGYLLLFQSRGLLRAQDFAREFEISERTVYRDVQALCEVGVPIVASPGEGYRLMEGYYLPPITFTPDEARALYLAVSLLEGLAAPGATQMAARTALEKVRAVLPAATLRQVEALQAILRFYAFPGAALNFDDRTFLTLQEAIHERRVVCLHYHAQRTNTVTERDVEPQELIFLDKTWMLTGYCRLRQEARTFRLDRIDKMTVRAERFTPRNVRVASLRQGSLRILIRFDPAIVRWVRERQHFTWVDESAGEEMVMVYRPDSFEQIEGWLLSWGDRLEVLEPAALRARLAEIAARLVEKYQPIPLAS